MFDQTKVDRIKQLETEIKERVTELNGLLGGEKPKRTWTRKTSPEETPPPETT